MSHNLPTRAAGATAPPAEAYVIVRYDPELCSAVTGDPAEARITYEHDDGEAVMVVTFGPVMPTVGDGWLPAIYQMRACVAPRLELDDQETAS